MKACARLLRLCLLYTYASVALLSAHVSMAAALSPIENKISVEVVAQQEQQRALLEKLVNINSGTTNPEGVRQIGEMLRPMFTQLGFTTRWVEEPADMHKAGTLIAERRGNKGKRVLLIGHLDTVFPNDSKFQRFELHQQSAKGPGVLDDKGGLVVMLYALRALQAVHALDATTLTIVLTGDEEDSGKPTSISRKPLIEAAHNMDVALDFEPTITLPTATIARRGITNWTIEAHGNESHSATIFQTGVGFGAIFELARILNTMRTQLLGEKGLVFNPGLVLGGTKINFDKVASQGSAFGKQNVVAKTAIAKGDFRFLTFGQKKSFETRLTSIVQQSLPGTKSSVTFEDGIPSMSPTAANLELLNKYSAVSVDLGQAPIKPLDATVRGAGDISHIASIVPANLAGLGPMGMGTHAMMEMVELRSLPIQTQRAALLIYRLTR